MTVEDAIPLAMLCAWTLGMVAAMLYAPGVGAKDGYGFGVFILAAWTRCALYAGATR